MDSKTQIAKFNGFINTSFRDIADKDYIAARICNRVFLSTQFWWFSLQAIEKYLKAILLYNRRDIKSLSHNLDEIFSEVTKINDISFDLPDDVGKFISILNDQGKNRYLEYPSYTIGDELLKLDRAVWHIRRYCYYLRVSPTYLQMQVRKITHKSTLENPIKFRIIGGFL